MGFVADFRGLTYSNRFQRAIETETERGKVKETFGAVKKGLISTEKGLISTEKGLISTEKRPNLN